MATIIPAIKAKMGSTNYYQTTMKASELVRAIRPAEDMDDWGSMGVEERMQRELNKRRVRNEIVPYLKENPNRFFGSFVVLVFEAGRFAFESVLDYSDAMPSIYTTQAQNLGFLEIEGGQLVALDGQHRLKAFSEIIVGGEVHQGTYVADIPRDEVSVIFIEYENDEKTRMIFNKINRHAKSTSRSDNLITSEDDAAAIVSRRLLSDGAALGIRDSGNEQDYIVNWKSNTIPIRSTKLTTLGSVNNTVKALLEHSGYNVSDLSARPSDSEIDEMFEIANSFWQLLIDKVTGYNEAITDPSRIPQLRQMETRDDDGNIIGTESPYSLMFRPVGLEAMVYGMIRAVERSKNHSAEDHMDFEEAFYLINQIDWRMSATHWAGTVVRRDDLTPDQKKIVAGKAAVELASETVAYLIGKEYMSDEDVRDFTEKYLMVAQGVPADSASSDVLSRYIVPVNEEQEEGLPI